MDENLYDEFGNYIGPDIPEVEGEEVDDIFQEREGSVRENLKEDIIVESEKMAITRR